MSATEEPSMEEPGEGRFASDWEDEDRANRQQRRLSEHYATHR